MSFNGSGTFLINTAGQPVVSGTVISSTAFNALTADLATGLSTAITKDGQTTVTANIPMSTYKFTGLGVGSAATDSANLSQVQSTVTKLLNSVSGADTITATASPTLAAYAAGQMFYFVAAGDNTTSVTLNIDALGAKAVTRDGSTALVAADIKSGEVIVVVYDGTRFQVVSQLNSAGDARFANVSIASSLYVGGVSTFVGNAGFSANVSIASALSVGGVAAITGATTIGGNLTLSGGTANGVAYLDGSKVVTSGSAVTYNGTTFALGAAWTTNPFAGTTAPVYFQYSASSNVIRLAGDAGVSFAAFRFSNDSGAPSLQLGKARGTYASPSAVQTGDNLGDLQFRGYGGTNNRTLANVTAFVETYTSDSNISSYLEFRTSSSGSASATEKMRLTAAGDLGIGTASPSQRLHISTATTYQGILINGNQAPSVCFATSTNTTPAWKVGLSGNNSANFAISSGAAATDAVTIDSSGNLGLGVTPSAWLSPFRAQQIGSGIGSLALAGRTDGGDDSFIGRNVFYGGSPADFRYIGTGTATRYRCDGATHAWSIAASGTAGDAISFTSAMTLDSGARLLIGTTTKGIGNNNNTALTVAGGATVYQSLIASGAQEIYLLAQSGLVGLYGRSNDPMLFGTNNTERARLTSGGNLLVGKASEFAQAFRFVVEANSSTSAIPGCFADPRTDAASAITVAFYRNGTKVGSVDTTDVATAYVTSSDRRLKDNIVSADDAGSVIDAIEVVKHDWKVGGHTRYGMIAQDLHIVVPEAVSVGDADDVEDFKNPWGVDYSKLVPMLVKEVQSLRKRVAELESK